MNLKLVAPFFIGIAAILMGVFYLYPAIQSFQAVRLDTIRLEEISAEFDELIVLRNSLAEKINAIVKEDFERLERVIPATAQGHDYLVAVSQLAQKNSLLLTQLGFSENIKTKTKTPSRAASVEVSSIQIRGEEKKAFEELKVNLGLAGAYESVKSFLKDLESHVRLTDVKDFTLDIQGDNISFDLKGQVKAYYLP